jgi:hypothetical protein
MKAAVSNRLYEYTAQCLDDSEQWTWTGVGEDTVVAKF